MMEIAEKDPLVCKVPLPTVRFTAFGASSLDFELRCWVPRPEMCGQIIDALNSAVYKEFTRLGVEIPYAKQDLYIKGLPRILCTAELIKTAGAIRITDN